jgi:hypothetical protein
LPCGLELAVKGRQLPSEGADGLAIAGAGVAAAEVVVSGGKEFGRGIAEADQRAQALIEVIGHGA